MNKFSLFGIPLQQDFNRWIEKQGNHLAWSDAEQILQESPGLIFPQTLLSKYIQREISQLLSLSPLMFNQYYQRIQQQAEKTPLIFTPVLTAIRQGIFDTIEHKIQTRPSRAKFNYDIVILNYAQVTGYTSENLTQFYETQQKTWNKIDHKDAIDYQLLASILPSILDADIRRDLEKYLFLRLCKQDKLENIDLWKHLTITTTDVIDPDYFSRKIRDFLASKAFIEANEDDQVAILTNFSTFIKEEYVPIIFHNSNELHHTRVFEWLAQNHYDAYKLSIFLQKDKHAFSYPNITKESFSLEEILSAITLDNVQLPDWFKELHCYNEEIQLLNDVYFDQLEHHTTLSPEYLMMSLIKNTNNHGLNSNGVSEVVANFFNRNQLHFNTLQTSILNQEHEASNNIATFLIHSLAGGKEILAQNENTLKILYDIPLKEMPSINSYQVSNDKERERYQHALAFYMEMPLKILLDNEYFVFLSNGKMINFHERTTSTEEYNQKLIATKNQLRQFLMSTFSQDNEITLFM